MQQFIDYIAIFAFVIVYFTTSDIFLATGVLMVGVTLQIGVYWLMKKPIGPELKFTFWASIIRRRARSVTRSTSGSVSLSRSSIVIDTLYLPL